MSRPDRVRDAGLERSPPVFIAVLQVFAAGVVVAAAAYLLVRLHAIVLLFIVALIVASGLAPLVSWLHRRSRYARYMSRSSAAILSVSALALVLLSIGVLVWLPASSQIGLFFSDVNAHLYQVSLRWNRIQSELPWLPDLRGIVDRVLAHVKARARSDSAEMAQFGFQVLQTAGAALTVLVITLYLLIFPVRFDKAIAWTLPHARRSRVRVALARVGGAFQRWILAQSLVAVVVGSASFAVYLALGLPYPHLLGMIAAFCEFIPVVGPVLAALVAFTVALFQSPRQAAGVAVTAVVLQLLEGYVIIPHVMDHVVGISPLVTILALLAGFELMGPLGGLIALPLAAALQIMVPELVAACQPYDPRE